MIDSSFRNANILIVDDMKVNIDILAGLLEIQGYTNVKYTTDPRLVVGLYHSFNPDLILLDLMMPYFDGYEIMAQLKELIPVNEYMPILVVTADISTEAKQRALSEGAKDFLAKPFDLFELGLRIDNLLVARYLNQQLQNQNQNLEQQVKERTAELEKTNIDLKAAKEKAELSDRLKTAFLNNISHEFRTPLSGILGMSQVLIEPELSQTEKEVYYRHLQVNSDRLIATVTNYVDMALLITGSMDVEESEFSPEVLLDEIYNKYRRPCETKQLGFNLYHPREGNHFIIKSSYDLLHKALSHLVDNAIKFTSSGSVIFGYKEKGTELEFFVKDTGAGIDEAAQAKIFEKFAQENISNTRGHEGSGLGLTIAKDIIGLLGGHISMASAKGHGSTFYVTIPCVTPT